MLQNHESSAIGIVSALKKGKITQPRPHFFSTAVQNAAKEVEPLEAGSNSRGSAKGSQGLHSLRIANGSVHAADRPRAGQAAELQDGVRGRGAAAGVLERPRGEILSVCGRWKTENLNCESV